MDECSCGYYPDDIMHVGTAVARCSLSACCNHTMSKCTSRGICYVGHAQECHSVTLRNGAISISCD